MANKTVTVKTSGGDYTSLNAALAGESADLVTNTCILTIECYAMEDTTTATTGTGYTTSASYYINIVVPTSERHDGKRNTSKYRLHNSGTYVNALYIAESYTRMTGLQIKASGATNTMGLNIQATYCRVLNCLIYDTPAGYGLYNYQTSTIIANTAVMNCANNIGVRSGSYYNVVSVNSAGVGIMVANYHAVVAKNCYAGGNAGADYSKGTTASSLTLTSCYSEDGTESTTQAAFATDSGCYFTNVTAGSEDLNIGASSALIGAATNLYNDATYPFQDDIIGTDRGGSGASWDIGVFEYVAAAAGQPTIKRWGGVPGMAINRGVW